MFTVARIILGFGQIIDSIASGVYARSRSTVPLVHLLMVEHMQIPERNIPVEVWRSQKLAEWCMLLTLLPGTALGVRLPADETDCAIPCLQRVRRCRYPERLLLVSSMDQPTST